MKSALTAFAVGLALAGSALAGEVELRAEVGMNNGRVTLGDIFEGAGGASRVMVATAQGPSVVLDAGRVQVLARAHGLTWANAQGMRRIIARADASGGGTSTSVVTSRAANRSILAYARNLATGEIVQPQDLVWAKAAGAPADAPSDAEAMIGKAAKRALREGAAAAMRDVSAPQVIARDEIISVAFQAEGITLTLQAKAVTGAAVGETLNVLNPASKKIIQAVAIGPGEAVVGPDARAAKAANLQFASLR